MNKTLKTLSCTVLFAICLPFMSMAAGKVYSLTSPDGRIKAEIKADGKVTYSVTFDGKTILEPSGISMTLDGGTVFGSGKVTRTYSFKNNETLPAVAYKKANVKDVYNALVLSFKE